MLRDPIPSFCATAAEGVLACDKWLVPITCSLCAKVLVAYCDACRSFVLETICSTPLSAMQEHDLLYRACENGYASAVGELLKDQNRSTPVECQEASTCQVLLSCSCNGTCICASLLFCTSVLYFSLVCILQVLQLLSLALEKGFDDVFSKLLDKCPVNISDKDVGLCLMF